MRLSCLLTVSLLLLLLFLAGGCGSSGCAILSMNVGPQTAVVDHSAPPPANEQAFIANSTSITRGCGTLASPQVIGLSNVTWSVSDVTNVSITNSGTAGVATCVGPTSGAVTVTANLPADKNNGRALAATAKITCN